MRLKAKFENKDERLFPNQFVNVRLLVDTKQATVLVATPAVQRGPDSTFVYVVKSDSTVDLRTIVTGPTEGNYTSVESGLEPGEVVVTDGLDKLTQGTQVVARDPDTGGKKKASQKTTSGEKESG